MAQIISVSKIALLIVVISLFSGCIPTVSQLPLSGAGNGSVEIVRLSISPNPIKCGKDITVTVRYKIKNVPRGGTLVQERMSVHKGRREVSVIQESESIVKNGEWENFLTFGIPVGLTTGKYTIKVQLLTNHSTAESSVTLAVR